MKIEAVKSERIEQVRKAMEGNPDATPGQLFEIVNGMIGGLPTSWFELGQAIEVLRGQARLQQARSAGAPLAGGRRLIELCGCEESVELRDAFALERRVLEAHIAGWEGKLRDATDQHGQAIGCALGALMAYRDALGQLNQYESEGGIAEEADLVGAVKARVGNWIVRVAQRICRNPQELEWAELAIILRQPCEDDDGTRCLDAAFEEKIQWADIEGGRVEGVKAR